MSECGTQRQRGEVDGVAVGAVTPLVASPDLEGVYGAGNQGGDGQRVGLAVHTCCTVHIRTLRETELHLVVRNVYMYVCVCVYLVVESELVLEDVPVGPVGLRP